MIEVVAGAPQQAPTEIAMVERRWWPATIGLMPNGTHVRRTRWAALLCLVTAMCAFAAELVSPEVETLSALSVVPILVAGALPSRRAATGIVGVAILLRAGAVGAGRLAILPAIVESATYVVIGLIVPALLPEWAAAPHRGARDDAGPVPRRRRTDLPGFGGESLPLPVSGLADRIEELATAASAPGGPSTPSPARWLRELGCALLAGGRLVEAEQALRRSVELVSADGDADGLSAATAGLALALALGGDLAEADRLLLEAAVGAQQPSTAALEAGAIIHWLGGRAPAAVSCAIEATTLSGGAPTQGRIWVMSVAAIAAAETGRIEEAGWYRAQAAAVAAACGIPAHHVDWADGIIAWRSGAADLGVHLLTTATAGMEREGVVTAEALALANLVEAAADADRLPAARAAAARLARIGEGGGALLEGLAASADAWAHLAAGSLREAHTPALAAERLFDAGGYRRLALRARHALGRALAVTDRAEAAAVLRETAAAYTALGDTWRAERVMASLRSLRASVRAVPTGLGSLTRRERQVVELAFRGMTAREIGEELFIGERTVEKHIANAYGKLGVHSKAELMSVAVELEPAS